MLLIPEEKKEIKKVRKRGLKKKMASHLRKISLLLANFFINHDFVFKAIGWFNKKIGFIVTIFVAYPASEEYANAYVYKKHRHKMRWLPWPAGFFKQNGKWGITFVISSTDSDFEDPSNIDNLQIYVNRLREIKNMLGAKQMTSAGIIPGMLHKYGLITKSPEAEVTVEAVSKAERGLRQKLGWGEKIPLIILGGKGFIGSRLIKKLQGREIYSVDCEDGVDYANWPYHLQGKRAILINITKKYALSNYLHLFWSELVLLNETYPEPSGKELEILFNIGSKAYHVSGVRAKSYPTFPRAYAGGIPCCAAWKSNCMKVIIKEFFDERLLN